MRAFLLWICCFILIGENRPPIATEITAGDGLMSWDCARPWPPLQPGVECVKTSELSLHGGGGFALGGQGRMSRSRRVLDLIIVGRTMHHVSLQRMRPQQTKGGGRIVAGFSNPDAVIALAFA